jgi:hypothetical protein
MDLGIKGTYGRSTWKSKTKYSNMRSTWIIWDFPLFPHSTRYVTSVHFSKTLKGPLQ